MKNVNQLDESTVLSNACHIALHHDLKLKQIQNMQITQGGELQNAIASSELLLISLGRNLPSLEQESFAQVKELTSEIEAKTWGAILFEAKQNTPENVDFELMLTPSEIEAVLKDFSEIGQDLSWYGSLDRYDVGIAVSSGLLSGLLDILLVGVPAHPGFLGGPKSEGGWLSNLVKDKFGQLLSPEKIKALEDAYKVSYDPSTSRYLRQTIEGLGLRTHRFQSLGHDPILGLFFGIRDILTGEFTAVTSNGSLIVQQVGDPFLQGEQLFIRIAEAIKFQLGHLASDVATPAGVPAPFMPLLMFLQFGKIGDKEYTIGEVARQMYRSGYDFRHFVATSIPILIAEVIVRLSYFVRSIQAGKSLAESIPSASALGLRRQLLISHSVALVVNAGKVCFTQNPLSISWAQILVFLRYAAPEAAYLLHGEEAAINKLREEKILANYHGLNAEADRLLANCPTLVV